MSFTDDFSKPLVISKTVSRRFADIGSEFEQVSGADTMVASASRGTYYNLLELPSCRQENLRKFSQANLRST